MSLWCHSSDRGILALPLCWCHSDFCVGPHMALQWLWLSITINFNMVVKHSISSSSYFSLFSTHLPTLHSILEHKLPFTMPMLPLWGKKERWGLIYPSVNSSCASSLTVSCTGRDIYGKIWETMKFTTSPIHSGTNFTTTTTLVPKL